MTDRSEALSQAVEALLASRQTRQPLQALPEGARPADKDEAYAIQNEVARRLGPVVAWKVGASGPDAEPSCAPINAATLFFGTERLPASMFNVIGIEAEIVYRFARDLPPREEPWSRREVLDAVASVHPGFEICDTRFAKYGSLDPLSHMADQANHGALIVGPAVGNWRGVDPVGQPLMLAIDGKLVVDVLGGNSAVDPVRLLVWLANVGARPFGGLHAGDTVTTGSCTGTIFIEPGSRSVARFADIGSIELTVQ
ncbi:fumarylacetoacetate hydrolase family protein [Azospirillum sp. TSO35-2]|uniref:2-keto-4-pentenoate hydratase n=1 Tax=Azospirillum sp. TSO35-2 TaxID=716796 RepID=UPI000D614927|nr:fumarylacetoacetate hydrolase family protein [Azospirillum sp. TSO35-2]PWC35882.1 2-keto-4-pentenoate hydratase [Azospirillum sp. TSO35-2]